MTLKNLNNNYKSKTFYNEILAQLKTKIGCFNLFENRIIEGKVYHFRNFSVVDIGFKYLTTTLESSITNNMNLKIQKLETILNDSHLDHHRLKNDLILRQNWSLIKKIFLNRCLVKGRLLNPVYNGFSIGVWGFVGFMPRKYSIVNKFNKRSVFVVMTIDYFKNTFVLSQNKIDKTSPRILSRLSSQLAYISKN